jgi:1-deoxy-D-xylulose-5-phosphate reductoisomerase
MKKISILGSTGSIGTQTLEIVQQFPDNFEVVGLSAGKNISLLLDQIKKFKPRFISVQDDADKDQVDFFIKSINLSAEVFSGADGLVKVATLENIDLLVVAVVGTAALLPTYRAIQKGITIGLACKEVLVAAGKPIMELAKSKGVSLLPIDSEHAAIKQCLESVDEDINKVGRLVLTASGGPFWNKPKDEFKNIELKDALKHPNWSMGNKITIDSATMMNKGLEVIEAHHLFQVSFSQIEIVVHPQSIIHSMVEFKDGNILAQMNLPDMRFPIQYVLSYPEKWKNEWPKLVFSKLSDLQFFDPDYEKFPMLKFAYEAGKKGGSWPVVLNAANERAVGLFLQKKIRFTQIPEFVKDALDSFKHFQDLSIEQIVEIDRDIKTK